MVTHDNRQRFDHIIVGTGQAASILVAGLPERESIAIIEGGKFGGTCVNVGCTPTKTLVASARVAHLARRAGDYGVVSGPVAIDFERVMERMNGVRGSSSEGLERYLDERDNTTLFRGWARFEDDRTLRVGDRLLEGDTIYLNIGARVRIPSIPGLDEVPWLDNVSVLELTEVPRELIVLGGGYIGLEFAQIFRRFGAGVRVVDPAASVMTREDPDVSQAVQSILEGEGIHFELRAEVVRVARGATGGIEVTIDDAHGARRTLAGSHLLLATGRVPNSDRIGVEAAGLDTDERGFIQVDDHARTSVESIFALGDVNGRGAFTHTSVNDAEIVLDTLCGGSRAISDRILIYALFTDPPLGRVGLTETAAIEQGYRVLKATRQMSSINRAREMGETDGFVKLLVDADTDLILGASILGVGGDEIINMIAALMYSGLPCHLYRKVVLVHPTVSELMPWILDDLEPAG